MVSVVIITAPSMYGYHSLRLGLPLRQIDLGVPAILQRDRAQALYQGRVVSGEFSDGSGDGRSFPGNNYKL